MFTNRFDDFNISEEELKKVSLCRTCRNFDAALEGIQDEYEMWAYPDEQCDFGRGEATREDCQDTGYGVVITKCPHYKPIARKDVYQEYRMSDRWYKKRRKAIYRSNFKCARCGSAINLNVHHITYERIFFEDDRDLVCLCENCHKQIHGLKGE